MYDSIDNLPVYLFDKINKTGNLLLLNKGSLKHSQKQLETAWTKINNEYINKFGISETFEQWLLKQTEIVEHYRKAYCEGQRHELNFAKIKEIECAQLLEKENTDFNELVSIASKYMNRRIDTKKETVTEFYSILKLMSKSGSVNPNNRKP